jgi:ABC-type Na+ efflux pump permease subunit
MSSLKTVWRVAAREIREHGRSRAFLITTALTFLLVAGLVVVPGLIGGGTSEYTVGGVGEGNDPIVASAELLGNASDEPDAELRPRRPWRRGSSTRSSSTGKR